MPSPKQKKEMREYNEFLANHVVMTIDSRREQVSIFNQGELKYSGQSEKTANGIWESLTCPDK